MAQDLLNSFAILGMAELQFLKGVQSLLLGDQLPLGFSPFFSDFLQLAFQLRLPGPLLIELLAQQSCFRLFLFQVDLGLCKAS